MTEGKPLPAWDTISYSQSLGPTERARGVSAMEQHYYQLLCAVPVPAGGEHVPTPIPTTQLNLWGSVLCHPFLAPDARRLQPFHYHSEPNPSSQLLEKRRQVYSMSTYTFLPQGFSNWQDSPQPPNPPHPLFPGRVNWRAGRDGLQRGECKMGRPHQTQGRRMASFSTFYETKPP